MTRGVGACVVACAALIAPATSAAATTKTVYVGTPPAAQKLLKPYSGDVNGFFLPKVTINKGDAVSFVPEGFHTVDIPAKGGSALPLLVTGALVTGVNDAAGSPFWFNGKVPGLGINPQVALASGGTTYNGSKRIQSGLPLGKPKPLKVTFTKTGTFKYFCDVHPGMVGQVVVLPPKAKAPSKKKDAQALAKLVAADVASAKRLAKTKAAKNAVSLGASDSSGVEDFAMFPSTLTVKAGTVVTFSMSRHSFETHTATFGPQAYLNQLANGFASPTFPPAGVYPSDPSQPIALDTTSHGNGFANVGALDNDKATAQVPSSGQIKFTAPGTYNFICLIHPFMTGKVVVTP